MRIGRLLTKGELFKRGRLTGRCPICGHNSVRCWIDKAPMWDSKPYVVSNPVCHNRRCRVAEFRKLRLGLYWARLSVHEKVLRLRKTLKI